MSCPSNGSSSPKAATSCRRSWPGCSGFGRKRSCGPRSSRGSTPRSWPWMAIGIAPGAHRQPRPARARDPRCRGPGPAVVPPPDPPGRCRPARCAIFAGNQRPHRESRAEGVRQKSSRSEKSPFFCVVVSTVIDTSCEIKSTTSNRAVQDYLHGEGQALRLHPSPDQ